MGFLGNKGRRNSGKGQEKFIPSEGEMAVIEKCTVPGTVMPDLDAIFAEEGVPREHVPHMREIISAKRYENVVKGVERYAALRQLVG